MTALLHQPRPVMTALLYRLTPRTLRGRLSLVALTTATLLMVILTVAFNAVAQQRLQHQADDQLHSRAAAVATTVDTSGTAVRVLETPHDNLLDANVWIYAGRRLLEEPPAAGPVTRVADGLARRLGRRCVTAIAHGHPLRLCSQPLSGVSGNTSEATVVTALDLSPYRSSALVSGVRQVVPVVSSGPFTCDRHVGLTVEHSRRAEPSPARTAARPVG